jgi:maltooligosyltrehalose trehalohydrolase
VLCSPFLPLLFMGEEYGETAPFHFFVSHLDPELLRAVRRGRLREMGRYGWMSEPVDPGSESAFVECKLNPELRRAGDHQALWSFYRELLRLRRETPALRQSSREQCETEFDDAARLLVSRRSAPGSQIALFLHFGDRELALDRDRWLPGEGWKLLLDSADAAWHGPGSRLHTPARDDDEAHVLRPWSCTLFQRAL